MVLIYALRDPVDGSVRYIGATKDRESRMQKHLSQHRRPVYSQWIAGLIEQGLNPEFEVLEEAPKEQWPIREKHWLAHHRALGAPLLNRRDGGGGGGASTAERTEAHRQNLSKALMGHVVPQTVRQKISETKLRARLLRPDPEPVPCSACGDLTQRHSKGKCQRCYDRARRPLKGRPGPKSHCMRGLHEMSGVNVMVREGKRQCRQCFLEYQRNYYRTKKVPRLQGRASLDGECE